jgi:hypothetical protein
VGGYTAEVTEYTVLKEKDNPKSKFTPGEMIFETTEFYLYIDDKFVSSVTVVAVQDGEDGVDGVDGKDGAPGKDGKDGVDGKDGADGYTPIKGVDYFDGTNGTNGQDGTSIVWKGSFETPPASPQNGWAYYNSTAKASYIYQSGSWYQMSIDGVDGQNGQDGQDGKDGSDGSSIVWKGESSNAPANPQENWVYKDTDDGKVYIYNGHGWELMVLDGSDGVDGAPGRDGVDGKDGKDGVNGSDGLSVFITYNDSTETPNTPTGNGTTDGWHTNATSTAIWISQKVAASANEGTWGTPIKIKGEDGVGISYNPLVSPNCINCTRDEND